MALHELVGVLSSTDRSVLPWQVQVVVHELEMDDGLSLDSALELKASASESRDDGVTEKVCASTREGTVKGHLAAVQSHCLSRS